MNIRNILCPVDYSENSKLALAYATSLANEYGAELHIVHAYEEPFAYTDGAFGGSYIPPSDLKPEQEKLETISPPKDVRFRREFLIGFAPSTLLDYAEANEVDLIVMGTHGRTGLSRLVMGSVAEAVVRRAKCPVLTIKTPAPEGTDKTSVDAAVTGERSTEGVGPTD